MSRVSHLGYFAARQGRRTNVFPAWLLWATGALLLFTAGTVLVGRITGMGADGINPGRAMGVRDIVIVKDAAEQVLVRDARSGLIIAQYGPQDGGFVQGSLRAFNRMRQVAGVPPEAAYRLIRWENGQVSLSDTVTGERIYLEPFGRDSAAAFAALLTKEGARP